jgi:hypothetical protein
MGTTWKLILAFNAAGVRYLLIGGQAMRLAGNTSRSTSGSKMLPFPLARLQSPGDTQLAACAA